MSTFSAMTTAQTKGFLRDRQSLFWIIAFPLMFLLVFGLLFRDAGANRATLVEVGAVPVVDDLPASARAAFDELFTVTRSSDRTAALEQVMRGEVNAAIEMSGTTVVLHITQADQVQAAQVVGTLRSFIDGVNLAVAGATPKFSLQVESVENANLRPIQYIAPGLIGWAVAMGALFNAAMPLVQWRQTGLLRRLRLSPATTGVLVGSRTVVTLAVALVQLAIFLGVGVVGFGLQLGSWWWMSVPVVLAAALTFMALGLVVGAVSKTPEAASGMANLIILPMAFLAGSFIPLDQAPGWLSTVAKFLPLGYLNTGLVDLMVRGSGPGAAVVPILALLGFAVAFTALATRVFRWES